MSSKRILVKVYRHDEFISLDRNWYDRVSGGKCIGTETEALLTEDTYGALVTADKRKFDYDFYDSLLERGRDEDAQVYIADNARDVELDDGDYEVPDADTLTELIDEVFDGELTIERRTPDKLTAEDTDALQMLKSALNLVSAQAKDSDAMHEYLADFAGFTKSVGDIAEEISHDLVTIERTGHYK